MNRIALARQIVRLAQLIEGTNPTGLWYHGRRHKGLTSRERSPHGGPAHQVPIFLSPKRDFAVLYVHGHGYLYTVRPHVTRTFDPDDIWIEGSRYVNDHDSFTKEGQKILEAIESNEIFSDGSEDSAGYMTAILRGDYNTMEHGSMVKWLQQNGYDSFYVTGDGVRNLAVFDPEKIEIVDMEPLGDEDKREPAT